ncbi:zinc ribbon domain-containing protein [Thermodesulfobacteriota bacterium]
MKDKISRLILLQDCDDRINGVNAKKKEEPLKIQELENELKEIEMRFQEEYDTLESLKKDRRAIEQEVQDLENKAEKSQIKLNSIKSNKEYTAVLKEIEDLDRQKSVIEDKLLQLMEQIEELEKKCLENREEQARLKKKFDLDKAEIEKEIEKLNKTSDLLEKQRLKFCKEADQDLLRQYDFIKGRKGGQGIGPVVGGVCQACHLGIPPQQFNDLLKCNSLLTCPNCNRLIYWGEDEYFLKVLDKGHHQ